MQTMQQNDEYEVDDNADEESGEQIQALGWRLTRLAQEQIGIRQQTEDRWLSDLEQYMGHYDAETLERLKKSAGSQAFVNITRSKSTGAESRLADMLFPSDDTNWAIQPTPVPELQKMAMNQETAGQDEQGNEVTHADLAKEMLKEAHQRAEAMTREIDDQLVEAKYHTIAREVIHDACLFGTGILKGPVVINRSRKNWKQLDNAVYELDIVQEYRPGVERVNVWDWFPDMSATKITECGFIFERRYVTKKQLIELSKRPGYLKEQIKKIIAVDARNNSNGSSHVGRLRELSGVQANINDNRYELWEYHGPATKDDLESCGCMVEDDDLIEHDVIVSFINGVVIKADLNPLETGECPYSVFAYEDDDTSVFGFGIPYLLRNEQRIVNAAWRMLLDNAALSTGPQLIINRELVTPSDGSWDLKARKVWWLTDPEHRVNDAFGSHEIASHQAELSAIFETAKNMASEVTSLPMLAQGEVGGAQDTAAGRSMLLNAANTVLRNVVKAFDDGITKPFIGRMYDWNMQNSDIEEIKGDFEIDARGSSALLVKETQTQALLNLMSVSTQPIYTDLTKHPELYRKAIQAQHLNPDDIVKTNDELEAEKNKPDPMQQAMMEQQAVMMQLQVQELQGKIDKLTAETADINVKTQFSAMQTAGQIVQMPQIVPVGDELMKSAGYKDANGTPSTVAPQGMEQQQPDMQQDQMLQQNTSPGSPALPEDGMPQDPNQPQQADPQSAAQGMNQGIETQQIEARAEGGPVNAGQPYLVGEQGPEVIVPNGSGTVIPNGQSPNLYADAGALRSAAEDKYKYLRQHNIAVSINPQQDRSNGYAETYPIGETGPPNKPAPGDVNRHRIEIFRPSEFSVNDLAAEGLHIDPYSHQTRAALLPTLTSAQVARLQQQAGDYQMSVDQGLSEKKAMENTIDSAMRGHAFNQDNNLVNEGMNYSPKQMQILNNLKNYVETGNKPKKR